MQATPRPQPFRPDRRVLERLARSALAAGGADHAAVGWVSSGAVASVGDTDLTALVLTEEQVRTGSGPLVDAMVRRALVEEGDLPTAPAGLAFAALAAAHNVVSISALPVLASGLLVGVVALYRSRPGTAAPGIAEVVANAARVLAPRRGLLGASTTVDLAAEALGQANGVSHLAALTALRAEARRCGVPLEDVAAGVLDGSVNPEFTPGELPAG